MCEILIKAIDAIHPDPVKDRRGCYKRGDFVTVQPDGHKWGKKETLPHFVVVKIPGIDPKIVRELVQPQIEDDDGVPTYKGIPGNEPVPAVFRRRRWRLLVHNLPATIKQTLLTNGEITVTPSQVRNYIRRIRDDLQYQDI